MNNDQGGRTKVKFVRRSLWGRNGPDSAPWLKGEFVIVMRVEWQTDKRVSDCCHLCDLSAERTWHVQIIRYDLTYSLLCDNNAQMLYSHLKGDFAVLCWSTFKQAKSSTVEYDTYKWQQTLSNHFLANHKQEKVIIFHFLTYSLRQLHFVGYDRYRHWN